MGTTVKIEGPFGHLTFQACLHQDVEAACLVLKRLPEPDRSLKHVTRQPEDDGVEKFNEPFDKLMATWGRGHAP